MAPEGAGDCLLRATAIDLERGYRRLLTGVTLQVNPGDLWQLSGANGAGKTSFLRALAGLATLGVMGSIERFTPLLYQGHLPALKPSLTAMENLRWHPSGGVHSEVNAIYMALEQVGLAGLEEVEVQRLSAGQQRRVSLARLWLTTAPLWLLDEPFTAIDVDGANLLEHRILAHCEAGGAVVFTSHQPNRMHERLQILSLSQYAA